MVEPVDRLDSDDHGRHWLLRGVPLSGVMPV
jgi:hypothetical protein